MSRSGEDFQPLNALPVLVHEQEKNENDHIKESEGNLVLCMVCGSGGSSFNYGVYCCSACKMFYFRNKTAHIPPCIKNQQCSINRFSRNSCTDCRFKKCLAVGMSNKYIRIGRTTKHGQAKILGPKMIKKAFDAELEDEGRMFDIINLAHQDYCDYTKEKVAVLLEKARSSPEYTQRPPQLVRLLKAPHGIIESGAAYYVEDFMVRFESEIKGVVEFARKIPGFTFLPTKDQMTLLRAAVFEVHLLRMACMFICQAGSFICRNGQVLRHKSLLSNSDGKSLLRSIYDFAKKINELKLSDLEVGLFCAIVVLNSDREGLECIDMVERVRRKVCNILQNVVTVNHPEHKYFFRDLLMNIPLLIKISNLHSEKLLTYQFMTRNKAFDPWNC